MSKQTALISSWLNENLFSQWHARMESAKHKPKYTVCSIYLELSNMGKQTLNSHSKGKKHIDNMKLSTKIKQEQPSLKPFFL